MGVKKQDEDLTILLTRLYAIQEQVGAVEKTSDEDKKNRAAQAGQVQMGKGRKGKKTGSRFLELKSSIVDRLKSIHALQEEQSSSKSLDPKVGIAAQAEIRELVRQAKDEWNELNELYKKEARKKKSKFTPEELEVQQALVFQLNAEIEKVKDVQMSSYARGGAMDEGVKLNLSALAALDAVDFQTAGGELITFVHMYYCIIQLEFSVQSFVAIITVLLSCTPKLLTLLLPFLICRSIRRRQSLDLWTQWSCVDWLSASAVATNS